MGNIDEAATLAFARRFFAAVAEGDLDTVRDCYAPDAVIWQAYDQSTQTREQNLALLGWIKDNVRDFRYEDVRCEATPTGFVEQHMTCGVSPSGKGFRVPACVVVRVANGRITRLDEYLDSAQVAAIVS
jgi:ketosteroid isomerase-like protein